MAKITDKVVTDIAKQFGDEVSTNTIRQILEIHEAIKDAEAKAATAAEAKATKAADTKKGGSK